MRATLALNGLRGMYRRTFAKPKRYLKHLGNTTLQELYLNQLTLQNVNWFLSSQEG